jgi:hypothetical protein
VLLDIRFDLAHPISELLLSQVTQLLENWLRRLAFSPRSRQIISNAAVHG